MTAYTLPSAEIYINANEDVSFDVENNGHYWSLRFSTRGARCVVFAQPELIDELVRLIEKERTKRTESDNA